MLSNDVLRSVRYLLDLSEARMLELCALGGLTVERQDIIAWLKKEDEEGFVLCEERVLAHFLDGLVIFKRGKQDDKPLPPISLPLYNNVVLKKLRVAFELKEADLLEIMLAANFKVSKPELSAFFRAPEHKNYRRCGDQFLRNFLKGLTLRIRGGERK